MTEADGDQIEVQLRSVTPGPAVTVSGPASKHLTTLYTLLQKVDSLSSSISNHFQFAGLQRHKLDLLLLAALIQPETAISLLSGVTSTAVTAVLCWVAWSATPASSGWRRKTPRFSRSTGTPASSRARTSDEQSAVRLGHARAGPCSHDKRPSSVGPSVERGRMKNR